MMRGKTLLTSVAGGLAALVMAAGLAQANHVRIQVVPSMPDAQAVIVPQTLQVDEIKAHEVRAQTIYANRIDTDRLQGLIYQTAGLEGRHGHGEVRAPAVSASVIYADTISANSVVADAVYVRDLRIH
jgi:hypothetical protein